MADTKQKPTTPPFETTPSQKFNAREFGIGGLSYPSDLFSNQRVYGGNYVLFNINVNNDSRLLTSGSVTPMDTQADRNRGTLAGQKVTKGEGMAAATGIGAISGGAIGGNLKGGAVGAAIGLGAGAIVSDATGGSDLSRQQKTIKGGIMLHVPNQLSINYSMEWAAEDTFAFQAAAMASREVAKAVGSGENSAKSVAKSIATNLALSKTPISGALSAASGMAANPMKEQVFKNVNFRKFTFDYTFSPRTASEAATVKQIIQTFKLHMHPEYKDAHNFVFIYPSEFDITYYTGGTENKNLHRHPSCVLESMNVNYTPNGAFNTFEGGMPTQINVTLSFLELAILTKAQIGNNY
jgi:hypothetical protein